MVGSSSEHITLKKVEVLRPLKVLIKGSDIIKQIQDIPFKDIKGKLASAAIDINNQLVDLYRKYGINPDKMATLSSVSVDNDMRVSYNMAWHNSDFGIEADRHINSPDLLVTIIPETVDKNNFRVPGKVMVKDYPAQLDYFEDTYTLSGIMYKISDLTS